MVAEPGIGAAACLAAEERAAEAGAEPLPPAPRGRRLWVYDCESFSNLFLCVLTDGVRWRSYDHRQLKELAAFVRDPSLALAGFNSSEFDDRLLAHIARNPLATAAGLNRLSQSIINAEDGPNGRGRGRPWGEPVPWGYSIDVLALLNGHGSLKEWSCREGLAVVADSPVDFNLPCPIEREGEVARYCVNDVACTLELLRARWSLVTLRDRLAERFDLEPRVYCLTEPQLAQHTLMTLHRRRTGANAAAARQAASANPDNAVTEIPMERLLSPRVAVTTPPFQELLARMRAAKLVGDPNRSYNLVFPDGSRGVDAAVAGTRLALGVGGLHSADAPGVQRADATHALIDLDVASYYPAIIISERLAPAHLGEGFLADLTLLRDQRLAAKRAGDKATADALKIIINSTYGKLNDRWSPLRSVVDAMRVTVTGQWFLLMLIERLHLLGAAILSANTDGVTVRVPRASQGELAQAVARWQEDTAMTLERTDFAILARRDVNSYVARTLDGGVKAKGAFTIESGKGDGAVIKRAAISQLLDGIPPAETIAQERDVTAFLFYQRAKNGGELFHGESAMPGTVRWYASRLGEPMRRRNPGGTWAVLPHGSRAALALDITGWTRERMDDLDLNYYEQAAWALVHEVVPPEPRYVQQSIFDP